MKYIILLDKRGDGPGSSAVGAGVLSVKQILKLLKQTPHPVDHPKAKGLKNAVRMVGATPFFAQFLLAFIHEGRLPVICFNEDCTAIEEVNFQKSM